MIILIWECKLRWILFSFYEGLFTEGGGSVFPYHRLVILSLGLLNAVLLIAAVVIGIYCKYESSQKTTDDLYLMFSSFSAEPDSYSWIDIIQ